MILFARKALNGKDASRRPRAWRLVVACFCAFALLAATTAAQTPKPASTRAAALDGVAFEDESGAGNEPHRLPPATWAHANPDGTVVTVWQAAGPLTGEQALHA